jgi:hypothetical protein
LSHIRAQPVTDPDIVMDGDRTAAAGRLAQDGDPQRRIAGPAAGIYDD